MDLVSPLPNSNNLAHSIWHVFSIALEVSFNDKLDTGDPVMFSGQYVIHSPDMLLHARHNAHTSGSYSYGVHSPSER